MRVRVSVVIPVFNCGVHLEKTLRSVKQQSFKSFEVIVVDDCSSDDSVVVAKRFADRVLVNKKNSGPAVSRNRGIRVAKGDIIAFIDSDCVAGRDWLKNIVGVLGDSGVDCVMGNTKIPKSSFVGDCISELGFPGGANAGFENMWHVDVKGFTDHITSCNFAARKGVFDRFGVFDESFPLAGGEDPELSYRWSKRGVRIRYSSDVIVFHEPRKSIKSFVWWMVYRGRSNYHFKRKVGNVGGFVSLRLWSSWNILRKNFFSVRIFLVFPLLFLSFFLQQLGYFLESFNR